MAAVHQYEGVVNKLLGDGIMALFGAPLTLEDHALRACCAALLMHDLVRDRAADTVKRKIGDSHIRVGLNSGEVLVRSINNDLSIDYDAIGATVHLAARMEQIARPGTTRLTRATQQLVEGFVKTEVLGRIPIKGITEPVAVYKLVGAVDTRSRFLVRRARGLTRFFGRETECEFLARALGAAREERGQVVSIVGDAGIGKSRLLYEFLQDSAAEGCLIFEGACLSHDRSTLFLPIAELLRTYFQVRTGDDPGTVRERIVSRLSGLDKNLQRFVPAYLALLGISVDDEVWHRSDPTRRRALIIDAFKALIVCESLRRLVILVVEDLHWADQETLAALRGLFESLAANRILTLLSYRPEFREPWDAMSYLLHVRIGPLAAEKANALLDYLLGTDADLAKLKRLLIERTGGNPFFLEEMVRALLDSGVIAGDTGNCRVVLPDIMISVPVNVQVVLAGRIDRLRPMEKRLLQRASVIGKDFPLGLLVAVSEEPETELIALLAALISADLIYETRLFPEREYTFRHALTHEVALSGLVTERRRALHVKVVWALESLYRERLEELVERLAAHAFSGELWEKAARYSEAAGDKAASHSASRDAVRNFRQAIEALQRLAGPGSAAKEVDLRLKIRDSLFILGDHPAIPGQLNAALMLVQRIGDQRRLCKIFMQVAGMHWQAGRYRLALDHSRKAEQLAASLGETTLAALAAYRAGLADVMLGDMAEAVENLGRAIEALDSAEGRALILFGGSPFIFACSMQAWALAERGDFARAVKTGQRGATHAKVLNHAYSASIASFGLAHALLLSERYGDSVPVLEGGLEQALLHEVGVPLLWILVRLAAAYAVTGNSDRAEKMIRRADDTDLRARGMQDASSDYWLARAALWSGRSADAALRADRALQRAKAQQERAVEGWTALLIAETLIDGGENDGGRAMPFIGCAEMAARDRTLEPLAAHSSFARARFERNFGNATSALLALEDAFSRASRLPLPVLKARVEAVRHSLS